MKISAVISWIVILIIALAMPIAGAIRAKSKAAASTTTTAPGGEIDFQFEVLGKTTFSTSQMMPVWKSELIRQMDAAAKTPIQKVSAAVVVAELEGAEAIRDRLANDESSEARALSRWYFEHEPLGGDVVERMGWYGELAATSGRPQDDTWRQSVVHRAERVMVTIAGVYSLIIVAGVIGLGLFITAIVLLALGKLKFRVGRPEGPSHVYVEAFALYLSSYLLGSLVFGLFVAIVFPDAPMALHMLPLALGVLIAVVWPLVRGVESATLRRDWGVHTGVNPLLEAFYGILGYLAGLPLIAASAAITFLLIKISGTQPTHPIVNEITEHPWLMVTLAVVFAPVTEELLFRGAFVSHLRAGVGVVLSALISGLIFAAIHPQGWTLIPVLGGIGAVMALIRQWRDALIAPIIAHALHNGVLVTLMLLLMKP